MELITKKEFSELANHHAPHCVSIYIPTQRTGEEVQQSKARIKLKNHLQKIEAELEEYDLAGETIKAFLAPAHELLEDTELWHNLSDGLVVLIGENFFKYYTLPVHFEDFTYVADHFYLRPLMPMFHGDGRFFLLALSLQDVQFYECTRHTITKVYVEDLVPENLKEAVGQDYESKSLQYHTNQGANDSTTYHGQGRNSDEDKAEILRFCQQVNEGLMKMLHDEDAPMVVHCVDYIFPIYQEANSYPLLHDNNVSGNPEEEDMVLMHERAWHVMASHFNQNRKEKIEQFKEISNVEKVSAELNDIIPAAVNGRVDTLFLKNRQDVYGIFDASSQDVRLDDEKTVSNASLLNLAAVNTFLQDGNVYLLEDEEMPVDTQPANAILRY
jgi:hypothetical protein